MTSSSSSPLINALSALKSILTSRRIVPFDALFFSFSLILLLLFSTNFLSNQSYTDENGLLLGSTRHGFDTENSENARKFSELLVRTKSVKEAKEVLRNILLAKVDSSETGADEVTFRAFAAHAVARAKFGDGRESVAIVAPIGCLNDGDDRIKEEEADAVALALEMFFYVKSRKVKWLGRDVVLVVPTCFEYYERGKPVSKIRATEKWLETYVEGEEQGRSDNATYNVKKEDVFFRAGQIHQAFGIETPHGMKSFKKSRSIMFVKLHGWNGALPNQDIFEVAKFASRTGRGTGSGFSVHGTHVIDTAKTTKLEKWVEHTKAWTSFAKLSVVGKPTGVHSAFKVRSIDAFTMVYSKDEGGVDEVRDHRIENYLASGIALETAIRACNNLVEQLHHARFEYVLIGNDRYVGVAELAGTLGVMLFALGIKTLRVYENEKWMILSSSSSSSRSVKAVFSAIKISTYVLVMVVLIALAYFNVALALFLATFCVPMCLATPETSEEGKKNKEH
mmetsp:Transcript_1096/g.3245  ORF Transcript_1096/g.3245 Transcript_1096/m.3245 type:complete len:508 (-) Transcript_1096:54-1577(-)